MADASGAKRPLPAHVGKRAQPKKEKEVVVPRPKPKPKPKKAQVEVKSETEREAEHQYAELRPIRNSVHPYEPLCVETKEANPAAVHLQVPKDAETHYANMSAYREQLQAKETKEAVPDEKEDVTTEKMSWTLFQKQCHFPHWKIVLSALSVAAVVFVLVVILLVLAAVSLSLANKNTDRYNELEDTLRETAQQTADKYRLLETTTQQMAADIAILETTTNQMKDNVNIHVHQRLETLSQQITTLWRQLNDSQATSGNSSLTLERRIAQQEMDFWNISNRTLLLETKTSELNASLTTVNETLQTANNEVGALNTTIDGLKTEVETLSSDTAKLDDIVTQLTKNGPFNCTSYIYQTVGAPNVTNVTSPSYQLEPNSVSNAVVTLWRGLCMLQQFPTALLLKPSFKTGRVRPYTVN